MSKVYTGREWADVHDHGLITSTEAMNAGGGVLVRTRMAYDSSKALSVALAYIPDGVLYLSEEHKDHVVIGVSSYK